MKPEILKDSREKWFSYNFPLPENLRLVTGTFDLEVERFASLQEKLKSIGLSVWNIPEGAYSTIYFWSPVDEDLSTRIRARWYRKPVELKNLNFDKIAVDQNQSASLEIKVTFPIAEGKEYEIKYRQKSTLKQILEVSKNLRIAADILNSTEDVHQPSAPTPKIPQTIFTAIDKKHPSGFVPTVMVSAIREHFVADSNYPDRLRITIDHDYKYHSFWGTLPWEASFLGGYPYARMEIKVSDDALLGKAEEAIDIIRQEGGFAPKIQKHADQTFISHKYSVNRFPVTCYP